MNEANLPGTDKFHFCRFCAQLLHTCEREFTTIKITSSSFQKYKLVVLKTIIKSSSSFLRHTTLKDRRRSTAVMVSVVHAENLLAEILVLKASLLKYGLPLIYRLPNGPEALAEFHSYANVIL